MSSARRRPTLRGRGFPRSVASRGPKLGSWSSRRRETDRNLSTSRALSLFREAADTRPVRSTIRGLVGYGFRGAKVSYSQFGEDLIARFALDKLGVRHPRYIDIGAHHPFAASNTALFHESGSRGINIEPDPFLFAAFPRSRRRDINLNVGVLDRSGELDLYVLSHRDLSTFSNEEAEERVRKFDARILRVVKVRVRTLNEIFAEYAAPNPPEFMSVDAEGADESILRAFDFGSWSPEVICSETISFVSTTRWEKNQSLIQFMQSKGYFVLADTWLNTIFVFEDAWKGAMPESLSFTKNATHSPRGG